MQQLILTPEQSQLIAQHRERFEIRDSQGHLVGHLEPIDPELLALAKAVIERRKNGGPVIPAEQVQAHLARLTEIRESQGLDRETMFDLLRRMRAGENV
jgi:hypothetical protein